MRRRLAWSRGLSPSLRDWRDSAGLEVDLVTEQGVPPGHLGLIEIKSGQTVFGEVDVAGIGVRA